MNSTRARLAVSAVAFVLGVLLVIQFRAQNASGGLGGLSTQDLTSLVASLNDRNSQLRSQVDQLQGQLDQLQEQQRTGRSNVGDLQEELSHIRLWAGLDPAVGAGVRVTISGDVSPEAMNDMLNELRLAGAEAMAVESVRVVSGSVFGGASGALTMGGRPLPGPLHLLAIGDPSNLQAILSRPGGVIGRIQVAQPEVNVVITQVANGLALPATDRELRPADARPHV
ncbi:MAG TPA: DUF881 domain-containing protein [Candidatus Limnocylindrales bacterium]|nr:DUF881 domain-containing protein [Candidatus Limnocylindrales bacterium]